jgi:hypothetical protein
MIQEIFHMAGRLDSWFAGKLGRSYRALLGIGIAIEIVQHIREFPHVMHSGRGIVLQSLALLLFAALLLHQLGEMYDHVSARRAPRSRS